ncbi:hypothetical protein AOLI_G00049690 [Acnodon oligacanthus]
MRSKAGPSMQKQKASLSSPCLPHLIQCESWSTADSPPVAQVQFQVTVSSQACSSSDGMCGTGMALACQNQSVVWDESGGVTRSGQSHNRAS